MVYGDLGGQERKKIDALFLSMINIKMYQYQASIFDLYLNIYLVDDCLGFYHFKEGHASYNDIFNETR